MKILIDDQIFLFQRYGGISTYTRELYNELVSNAIDWGIQVKLARSAVFHRWRAIRLLRFILSDIFALIVAIIEKPDAIIYSYYMPSLLFFLSCKKICIVHDLIPEKSGGGRVLGDQLLVALKRISIANSDAIVFVSRNTLAQYQMYYGLPTKSYKVVYHGVSLDFKPRLDHCYQPYVLYVGNRGYHKRCQKLIDAYKLSRELRESTYIYFFGGKDLSQREKELLTVYNINYVYHSGEQSDLIAAYQNAMVLVVTSSEEGFCIPIIEAMSCGCPVICEDTSAMREIGGDAAQKVTITDSKALADAILMLKRNSTHATYMERGLARASIFSWRQCALDTLSLLKR